MESVKSKTEAQVHQPYLEDISTGQFKTAAIHDNFGVHQFQALNQKCFEIILHHLTIPNWASSDLFLTLIPEISLLKSSLVGLLMDQPNTDALSWSSLRLINFTKVNRS